MSALGPTKAEWCTSQSAYEHLIRSCLVHLGRLPIFDLLLLPIAWKRSLSQGSFLQMTNSKILDLPIDVLNTIIALLPLTDRARLETTSKAFHNLSRFDVTAADFTITGHDAKGFPEWLAKLSHTSALTLRTLHLFCGERWWQDRGKPSWSIVWTAHNLNTCSSWSEYMCVCESLPIHEIFAKAAATVFKKLSDDHCLYELIVTSHLLLTGLTPFSLK